MFTIKIPDGDAPTPCFSADAAERRELAGLFSSVDLFDHKEAAAICRGCYFRESCLRMAVDIAGGDESWSGVPSGTWGGVLFRNGVMVTSGYAESLARPTELRTALA